MCQVPSEDIAQIGAHWEKWSDPCQGQRERTVKEKISLCPSPSPLLSVGPVPLGSPLSTSPSLYLQVPEVIFHVNNMAFSSVCELSYFTAENTQNKAFPLLPHYWNSPFQFQNHFMSKSGLGIFLVVIISTLLCEMSLFFVSVPKPDTPDWSSARPEGTFLLNSAQSYEPPGELDLWSKLPAGCRTIKYIVLSSRIVTFEPPRKLLLPPRQKSTVSHKNFVIQIYKEEGKPKARKQGESISVYSSISSPASPEAG